MEASSTNHYFAPNETRQKANAADFCYARVAGLIAEREISQRYAQRSGSNFVSRKFRQLLKHPPSAHTALEILKYLESSRGTGRSYGVLFDRKDTLQLCKREQSRVRGGAGPETHRQTKRISSIDLNRNSVDELCLS